MKQSQVSGTGPIGAKILLIGEAPGNQELVAKTPFVGPAGKLLDNWLKDAGIQRSKIRIENVCEAFPPRGRIDELSGEDQRVWMIDLWQRLLEQYPDDNKPNLIIACGNFALAALTGQTKITKWRGSFIQPSEEHCRNLWLPRRVRAWTILPVLHPAYILRGNSGWGKAIASDFQRAKAQSALPYLKTPAHSIITKCTKEQANNWLQSLLDNPSYPIAIDIETIPKEQEIESIAFAKNAQESLSLSWESWVPAFTKKLCSLPNPKICHNGLYDTYWLRHADCPVNNYVWDTRYMHHILDPRTLSGVTGEDGHDLGYLQSIYTDEPFHKSMVKDLGKRSTGAYLQTKLTYGALDTIVTYKLYLAIKKQLEKEELLNFYAASVPLFSALQHLMDSGLRVNTIRAKATATTLALECADLKASIEAYGADIFGPKSISFKKLGTFLYKQCQLPTKKKKGKDAPATDKLALLQHIKNNYNKCSQSCTGTKRKKEIQEKGLLEYNGHSADCPGPIGPILEKILEYKDKSKQAEFMAEDRTVLTPRGAYSYCSYSPVTEEGRLKSTKNPYTWGTNHQNQPSTAKHIFVPDRRYRCPKCGNPDATPASTCSDKNMRFCLKCNSPLSVDRTIFLEVDLSQAESRAVYMLSGNKELLELAQIGPQEKDMHRHYASVIFKKPEEEITKQERQMGKKAVHASQRGMRGQTLSNNLIIEAAVFESPNKCQAMIDAYLEGHPGISQYFSEVRMQIMQNRTLVNPFGRRWQCHYDALDDNLWRAGYSFLPQSSVADLLIQHGLIPLNKWRQTFPSTLFTINATVHDSILLSCLPEDAYRIANYLNVCLSYPIQYREGGPTLAMPCEFAIGTNWRDKHEFKTLPPEEEMRETAFKLLEK